MKLLITGATGLYGSTLSKLAVANNLRVYACGIPELSDASERFDVTNAKLVNLIFSHFKPDVVVHAAALTDVDKCELNQALAWKINVEGTKNVIDAAKSIGASVVYISTDYVFDGKTGQYQEYDVREPVNYYGITKLKAEQLVESKKDSLIIRPSVIYGSTPASGKVNFVLWLIKTLEKDEPVKIITDQWISPTLNTRLAEMTLEAIDRRLTGIFHLSGATRISRYDFAQMIASVFELDNSLIEPVFTSQFTWRAKRPLDSSLDISKAQHVLEKKPLDIADSLLRLKGELLKQALIS